MQVGDWVENDYQCVAIVPNRDDTLQHRFVHRGMKWGFILRSVKDITDDEVRERVRFAGPKAEANYREAVTNEA